jgi:rhamnogalacturonyl hydrolase YesR
MESGILINTIGSYWYYVYHNVTTQDGLFSIPAFHSLYAREFNPASAIAAYQTSTLQFSNIVEHCNSYPAGGLLYHGYDPTRSFPVWGNLSSRGHSQSIWARAVGWTCTGLLTMLDVIPDIPATTVVRGQLIDIFTSLINAVVRAQDETSGAWWQVMEFPGREGNFLESSATGLFAHAILRGLRLGYLSSKEHRTSIGEPSSREQYKNSAKRAYDWLLQNALTDLGSGTLGYNLTVDVCSVNSTTDFDVSRVEIYLPSILS